MSQYRPDPANPDEAYWAAAQRSMLELVGCLKPNPLFAAGAFSATTLGSTQTERLETLMNQPFYRPHLPYIVHWWMNQAVGYAPGAGILINPRSGVPGYDPAGVMHLVNDLYAQIHQHRSGSYQVNYATMKMARMADVDLRELLITVGLFMISALDTCRAKPLDLLKTVQTLGHACGDDLPRCVTEYLVKATIFARAGRERSDRIWRLLVDEVKAERGWTVDSAFGGAVAVMTRLMVAFRNQGALDPQTMVVASDADGTPEGLVALEDIDPTPPPAETYTEGGDTLWAAGMMWRMVEMVRHGEAEKSAELLGSAPTMQHRIAMLAVTTRWLRDILPALDPYIPQ